MRAIRRREFLASGGAAALAVAVPRKWLFAQDAGIVGTIRRAAATGEIAVHPLRGGISVLMGSGGNIAVLSGSDGTLLIDGGITASRDKIKKALAGIRAAPVKHLVNTHWHFDHTDGNEWLHDEGATIVAHENTRRHLATSTRVEGWQFTFPPSPPGALPSEVFQTERTLHVNGLSLALKHYMPAHTDSDVSVAFTSADVLHVGDTWWNGYYPFIDYSTGGSIDGTIRAARENVDAVSAQTVVVPGHGPVGGKPEMIEYRDMLDAVRQKVAELKKQGRSLSEVQAARPTAPYDAKWGGFAIDGRAFTGFVYAGV
jgi:glyoxylase-like metal-dependent hydrolase (beta-lactamase superfamily II)